MQCAVVPQRRVQDIFNIFKFRPIHLYNPCGRMMGATVARWVDARGCAHSQTNIVTSAERARGALCSGASEALRRILNRNLFIG